MRIELNGQVVELSGRATAAAAVAAAGVDAGRRGIAVAVEGNVVPRSEWEATPLREGQRVEVLQAVQGG
jgi:sulfur carrier protein